MDCIFIFSTAAGMDTIENRRLSTESGNYMLAE